MGEWEMLLESLPLEQDPNAFGVQLLAERLGRSSACPPLGELMDLVKGKLEPNRAEQLHAHRQTCAYCQVWYQGLTAPWNKEIAVQEFQRVFRGGAAVEKEEVEAWSAITRFLTKMIRGRQQEAIEGLRPYLATFLAAVGIDPALEDRFAAFLTLHALELSREQAPLPHWLTNFARQELSCSELPYQPTLREWDAIFERAVLAALLKSGLSSPEPDETEARAARAKPARKETGPSKLETDETAAFRRVAQERREASFDRLPSLAQEENFSATVVDSYCSRFCEEGQKKKRRLLGELYMRTAG
jgi:hypothetical protein